MAEECALCPSSLGKDYGSRATRHEHYELFHQSCPTCSLTKLQDESMCNSCQYLRLRHLVRCMTPEVLRAFEFRLPKGLADISVATKCPLCRIVKHMLVVGLSSGELSKVKGPDYEIVLSLAPPHLPQYRSSSALLVRVFVFYYHKRENSVRSVFWGGHLCIDNIDKGEALSHSLTYT